MEKIRQVKNYLLNKKVAIISSDSGGAEILSSFVKKYKSNYRFTLSGPAKKIFKKKYKKIRNLNLIKNINFADIVITGTGLGTNLELNAILKSKKKKKKVFSFIDHWVNYKKRFLLKKKLILPDEIWVGDIYAKNKAMKIFRNVRLIPNPYFEESVRNFKLFSGKKKSRSILYVSSNRDRLNNKQLTDKKLFEKFLKSIRIKNNSKKIIIRCHPSEKKNKYNQFIKKNTNIEIDTNDDLIKTISKCSMVFGHNSMALAVSNICGLASFHINSQEKLTIPKNFIKKIIN